MRTNSLFAQLVPQMAAHPENVATEAFLYLLRTYPTAWPELRAFLALAGAYLPEALTFSTQASAVQDTSIPDLVGIDGATGEASLILEAKFWAGLTPNQPVTYLRRLTAERPGMVLVVAPALRFEELWAKLCKSCVAEGLHLSEPIQPSSDFRAATLAGGHHLALTSWRALLSLLIRDADTRDDALMLGDVEQLSGLCGRMDSTEFQPLSPADVSRHVGQRIQQFTDLVDKAVRILVHTHQANTKGLQTGGTQSTYGRFFAYGNLLFFLAMSPPLWAEHGETPLWLRVTEGWKPSEASASPTHALVRMALAGQPNRIFLKGRETYVGLDVLIGADRDEVLSHIVNQIRQIFIQHDKLAAEPI